MGGGCFWCTEGVFRAVPGVLNVVSGYAGDNAENANYQAVCTGNTKHVEVIKIDFDPSLVSLGQILKIFFAVAHDPTQENGQGHDLGPQYQSVIFYEDDAVRDVAQKYIAQIDAAHVFEKEIATRLEKLAQFYAAEAYHQNYATLNPAQSYICAVALPKIKKVQIFFMKD